MSEYSRKTGLLSRWHIYVSAFKVKMLFMVVSLKQQDMRSAATKFSILIITQLNYWYNVTCISSFLSIKLNYDIKV